MTGRTVARPGRRLSPAARPGRRLSPAARSRRRLSPAAVRLPLVRAPAVDTEAKTRRDYELAERVGTREAWDFFLAAYSDGFYAKLALAQRNKLAAEEARLANIEKASSAADEQS